MHHRDRRGRREKIEKNCGDRLSVLQGRENLKFLPDNITGKSVTLSSCIGLWTRAKAQSRKEKAYLRSLRLSALNE